MPEKSRAPNGAELPPDRELRLAVIGMAVLKSGPPCVLLPGGEPTAEKKEASGQGGNSHGCTDEAAGRRGNTKSEA